MKKLNIPEGYNYVMPYLIIPNALAFLEFTQKVFGAEKQKLHMNDGNEVMHGEIRIGDSTIMFANASEQWGTQPAGLYIHVENADETYQKALDAGATSIMAVQNMEYGRSGGIRDPHGNTWWVRSDLK